MRYWDASAIVPLVIPEANSLKSRTYLEEDHLMATSFLTDTEIISALCRKMRENSLTLAEYNHAKLELAELKKSWIAVIDIDKIAARANRLLEFHPLRTIDAIHLASASAVLETFEEKIFVSYDSRLALAANKEGFRLAM